MGHVTHTGLRFHHTLADEHRGEPAGDRLLRVGIVDVLTVLPHPKSHGSFAGPADLTGSHQEVTASFLDGDFAFVVIDSFRTIV